MSFHTSSSSHGFAQGQAPGVSASAPYRHRAHANAWHCECGCRCGKTPQQTMRKSRKILPGQDDTLGRPTRQSGLRGSRRALDATAEFAVMALRQGADLHRPGVQHLRQAQQGLANRGHTAAGRASAAMALRFLMALMALAVVVRRVGLIGGLAAMVEWRSGDCGCGHVGVLLILAIRQHRGVMSRRASLAQRLGHHPCPSMAGRAHQHGRRGNALNGNCQRQQPSQDDADDGVHNAIVEAAFEPAWLRASRLPKKRPPQ